MSYHFFGYDHEAGSIFDKFWLPETGLLCAVGEVTSENLSDINLYPDKQFSIGDYFITTGDCDELFVYGPFENVEAALNYGVQYLGVVSFRSPPEAM